MYIYIYIHYPPSAGARRARGRRAAPGAARGGPHVRNIFTTDEHTNPDRMLYFVDPV